MTTGVLEIRQLVQSPAKVGHRQPKMAKTKARTVQKETLGNRVISVMGDKVLQTKFVNKVCHPPTPFALLMVARLGSYDP